MTNIQEILKAAVEAVENASVPEDLRGIAFSKAIEALSGQPSGSAESGSGDIPSGQSDAIGSIAGKLGLPISDVAYVYRVEEGELALDLPSSALPASKKHAQQTIALLLSVGRQAAGEELTSFAVIRQACDDYGVKDRNFAKNMKGLDDVLSSRQQGKYVKVRNPGFERATVRIRELLQGGSA